MQVRRYLNDIPVSTLEGTVLHDEVIGSILAGMRERAAEHENN